jgi:uncharacterized protein (TIGR03437 family)
MGLFVLIWWPIMFDNIHLQCHVSLDRGESVDNRYDVPMLTRAFVFALALGTSAYGAVAAEFQAQRLIGLPLQRGQSVNSLTTDAAGNMIVTGSNGQGGFIMKLGPAGNVIFSFVNLGAFPAAAAVDANGDVYWIGTGGSPGFPLPFTKTILPVSQLGSKTPGFVVKFRGADGSILWAAQTEGLQPQAIAVDRGGFLLLAGIATTAPGFATPGAYQCAASGAALPMGIARLTPDGDAVFMATYGGHRINGTAPPCMINPFFTCLSTPRTSAASVLSDAQGRIWVAGSTNETDLPMTQTALKNVCGCSLYSGDGYLAEVSADGSSLLYTTYLGTSPQSSADQSGNDAITSAAMDAQGKIWLAGLTNGTDLPVTSNADQNSLAGAQDGFVLEYDPAANQLAYGTYYGTMGTNSISKLAIDSAGDLLIAGILDSNAADPYSFGYDFVGEITNSGIAVQPFLRHGADAGIAFSPSGTVEIAGSGSVITTLVEGTSLSPSVFGIANSASFSANGQVSPGEFISITGLNLGPEVPVTASLPAGNQTLATELGGVQVLFDGSPAPLLYVSSTQINAIVPFGVTARQQATMLVKTAGASSNPSVLGVVAAVPAVFLTHNAYQNLPVAAALNQDGSINSESNRAAPGSIVSIFAAGFGALTPAPSDGSLLNTPLPALQQSISVLFTPGASSVLYSGPAPDQIAGLMQINFRLPQTLTQSPTIFLFAGPWPSSYFTVWASGT